ncbi:MAG: hypothetical protein A2087_14840 [Spirochaetes bacterium GWD1_61_31]|nr:MAG: hypothetical protein A2Y37_09790 [Spirochaetes bacterium GWB1_60_80]OHD36242.1 MAG: hypothetical protein A2087_14840 [Spirochaetes bacterium GWD1_61_31]OHD41497.1 MAG: hypothetical protein A2Y35_06095 [Spirochaetes bacterium GWE1_60_18]OHD61399.1 MAG: hypothetical protein A2Y32_04485 [Spirochaetes bacterium GWF1_60_12]
MCKQGPRAATLKNIAGHAGVTEPAIFRHFDGVDGVFQSLFSVYELYFGLFQSYYKVAEYTGLDKLESALLQMMQALKTDRKFGYLLSQPDAIFRQYPKLKKRLEEIRAKEKASVIECLKEAKAKGQLLATVDVETTGLMVYGGIYALLVSWNDNIDGFDPLKEGRKLINGARQAFGKAGLVSKVVLKPIEKTAPATKPAAKPAGKTKASAKAKSSQAPAAAKKVIKATAAKPAAKADAKKPAATKPAAVKPAVAKPATAKPATAKPAATKPASAKPVAKPTTKPKA